MRLSASVLAASSSAACRRLASATASARSWSCSALSRARPLGALHLSCASSAPSASSAICSLPHPAKRSRHGKLPASAHLLQERHELTEEHVARIRTHRIVVRIRALAVDQSHGARRRRACIQRPGIPVRRPRKQRSPTVTSTGRRRSAPRRWRPRRSRWPLICGPSRCSDGSTTTAASVPSLTGISVLAADTLTESPLCRFHLDRLREHHPEEVKTIVSARLRWLLLRRAARMAATRRARFRPYSAGLARPKPSASGSACDG
jgi:hypothetical protein